MDITNTQAAAYGYLVMYAMDMHRQKPPSVMAGGAVSIATNKRAVSSPLQARSVVSRRVIIRAEGIRNGGADPMTIERFCACGFSTPTSRVGSR